MDIAGTLALTTLIVFFVGVGLAVTGWVGYFEWDDNKHNETLVRRFLGWGFTIIGLSLASWIVCIWLGAAQTAGLV